MIKAYKFRIYPDKNQAAKIDYNIMCGDYVYNYFLKKSIKDYKREHKSFNYMECSKVLSALKKEKKWLCDADSQALVQALNDLNKAYKRFFSAIKRHQFAKLPKARFPDRKTKSYKTHSPTGIRIQNNILKIPKISEIDCRITREIEGQIIAIKIVKNNIGEYYVYVYAAIENIPILANFDKNKCVGIDLGFRNLITTSDGEVFNYSVDILDYQKKIDNLEYAISTKEFGSRNYCRLDKQIKKCYNYVENKKRDELHKFTTYIVKSYDVIALETIDYESLAVKTGLNPYAFYVWKNVVNMIQYKAEYYGKKVIFVNSNFKSSKICSTCGYVNASLNEEYDDHWTCPNCKTTHDRDINAAVNLRNKALGMVSNI